MLFMEVCTRVYTVTAFTTELHISYVVGVREEELKWGNCTRDTSRGDHERCVKKKKKERKGWVTMYVCMGVCMWMGELIDRWVDLA